MSGHDGGAPRWIDRLRHWLWLDGIQRKDHSEAGRGFFPGGPAIYPNRRPVGRRFTLGVVALGLVIALVILTSRSAAAIGV